RPGVGGGARRQAGGCARPRRRGRSQLSELETDENCDDTLDPSALTATMAMTAMRARSRPYSTMLAPVSSLVLNLAWSQVLRTKRSMVFSSCRRSRRCTLFRLLAPLGAPR